MNLELLPAERARLRASKTRISDIPGIAVDEFCGLMQISRIRAMEIHALAEFQCIPSIGIRFARDLLLMGYYSLEELKDKDGAKLVEEFELSTGYWIDPCVEDQCRLVVHYANHKDDSKRWWHFTPERKLYRSLHGYPANRPKKAWFEI
jgi:hypothetical protein